MTQEIDTGLKILTDIKVVVPVEIGMVMNSILNEIPNPGLEYGLYLKGRWEPETGTVHVGTEYYIPKQTVTGVTIEFDEGPPDESWNVAIHRHPSGCRKFSGTDERSINTEFLASLLFLPPWDFPAAVVNVPLASGVKLQVPATIKIPQPFAADKVLSKNVKRRIQQRKVAPAPIGFSRGRPTAVGGTADRFGTGGTTIKNPMAVVHPAFRDLDRTASISDRHAGDSHMVDPLDDDDGLGEDFYQRTGIKI